MLSQCDEIINSLKTLANPEKVNGMKRYGINSDDTLGISIYQLRIIAKEIGINHTLALQLWNTGIHEARILAAYITDPTQITPEQMETWVVDFDSWDVCDQVCTSLFDQTSYAYSKAIEWSSRNEEFVKRAAFALIAGLAVHDKKSNDEEFSNLLTIIEQQAWDNRNYVKKAINWALRNIGKRNLVLNELAIKSANRILGQGTQSARWIARDALRELKSGKSTIRLSK